jgi:rhomboid protease GluP
MSDPGEGDAPVERGTANGASRDGHIDFSGYSLAQLRELQHSIDPVAFPLNAANLQAALERFEAAQLANGASGDANAVRHTRRDGWLGWITAKLRRQSLFGAGAIDASGTEIVLEGWQRSWLGPAIQASVRIPRDRIRNVARDGATIRFEIRRRFWLRRVQVLEAASSDAAERIVAALPPTQSVGFEQQWAEVRRFNATLHALGASAWVTPALVLLNVAAYVACMVAAGRPGGFEIASLLLWGGNYGPLTITGQWWRLLSALFLHVNLLHVVLNLWALWHVGRLVEKLYGRWMFVFLYLASGTLAGLASILWDPRQVSVGASGAIFGLFGALFAFLAHDHSNVPRSIVRVHWLSTLPFVLFNLVSGALQPGTDNAAHVGGLVGGFVLGWILVRPVDAEARAPFPFRQSLAAFMVGGAAVLLALLQTHAIRTQLTGPEKFWRSHEWYSKGEAQNLERWQEITGRAGAGTMSDAELAAHFRKDILPFWAEAQKRLARDPVPRDPKEAAYVDFVRTFVDLRLRAATTLISLAEHGGSEGQQEMQTLSQQANLLQARGARLILRESMDHRPRALASSPWVLQIRRLLGGGFRHCVEGPNWYNLPLAPSDDPKDAPALRHEAACRAQRLFMDADYRTLDRLLTQSAAHLEDLPDGSSTVTALADGLGTLFEYGGVDLEQAFGKTADWRRSIPGSINADLTEASMLEAWAWVARGHGTRDSVSPQGWAQFAQRLEMSAQTLQDIEPRASGNLIWHTTMIGLSLVRSNVDEDQRRGLFSHALQALPGNVDVYAARLHALMPRWGGSFDDVDNLISSANDRTNDPYSHQRYAELYAKYAYSEGDDVNVFREGKLYWPWMKEGLEALIAAHPHSDRILNTAAFFACRAEDEEAYRALRPRLEHHTSATAWTQAYTLEKCDKSMHYAAPKAERTTI